MKRFVSDLEALGTKVAQMGDLAEQMVLLVSKAVRLRGDVRQKLDLLEQRVDALQTEIDKEAVQMLALYGPVAADIRQVLVVTHVTQQLERMGDQAVNICEALEMMSTSPDDHGLLSNVKRIGELACSMVAGALDAYHRKDAKKAAETRAQDDLVDALNDQVMKELLTVDVLREVLSGATDIADAVAQILIARYFERIADQATNICKEVIYLVVGDDVRHRRPSEGAS